MTLDQVQRLHPGIAQPVNRNALITAPKPALGANASASTTTPTLAAILVLMALSKARRRVIRTWRLVWISIFMFKIVFSRNGISCEIKICRFDQKTALQKTGHLSRKKRRSRKVSVSQRLRSGEVRGRFRVDLESFWGRFGEVLGRFWGGSREILGRFRGRLEAKTGKTNMCKGHACVGSCTRLCNPPPCACTTV